MPRATSAIAFRAVLAIAPRVVGAVRRDAFDSLLARHLLHGIHELAAASPAEPSLSKLHGTTSWTAKPMVFSLFLIVFDCLFFGFLMVFNGCLRLFVALK